MDGWMGGWVGGWVDGWTTYTHAVDRSKCRVEK